MRQEEERRNAPNVEIFEEERKPAPKLERRPASYGEW